MKPTLFNVGIQYLVEKNERALFQLSKEERKVFQQRILDKIKD